MKKYMAFALLITIACLLFCGCGNNPEKVFAKEKYGDYDNFYLITEKTYDELDLVKLQYSGGSLLFTVRNYLSGDVRMFTYDIFSGEFFDGISAKSDFALNFKSGFLSDGNVYSFDCKSKALTFYDTEMKETQKITLPNADVDELYAENDFVLYTDGVNLYRMNLSDTTPALCGSFENLLSETFKFYGRIDNKIFLSGYNDEGESDLISYDVSSGECKDFGALDGKIIVNDGLLSYSHFSDGKIDIFDCKSEDAVAYITPTSKVEELIGMGRGKVCTSLCTGEDSVITQTLRIYSADDGSKIAETEYVFDVSDMYECVHEVYIIDDDFAVMELRRDNVHSFVLWKYAK